MPPLISAGPEAIRDVHTSLTDSPGQNYTTVLGITYKASSDIKSVALFLFPSVDNSAWDMTLWRLLESSPSQAVEVSVSGYKLPVVRSGWFSCRCHTQGLSGSRRGKKDVFVIKTARETQLPLHTAEHPAATGGINKESIFAGRQWTG